MKTIILLMGFIISTSAAANEGGGVTIKDDAANGMIFKVLESLKKEGNPSVYMSEEGDALILQLATEEGTLTCIQSEGQKNGKPVESIITCDVNTD